MNNSCARDSRIRLTNRRGTSRDSLARTVAERQFDHAVLRRAFRYSAAELFFYERAIFERDVQRESDIARKMVAADFDRGRQLHRFAEVANEFGGVRADIHHDDSTDAIFRQNTGIAGCDGLENRFVESQMGHIDSARQRAVLLRGHSDQMGIGYKPGGHHAARIVAIFLIVHHKCLRQDVQHHAIILQFHAHGAIHRAVHIALLDFARPGKIHLSLVARTANRKPADARHRGFDVYLSHRFGLLYGGQDAFRYGLLVNDPALRPARARRTSAAQEAQFFVFDQSDHHPRVIAAGINARREYWFRYHACSLLTHQNPVIQPQVKHCRVRILPHFPIVTDEIHVPRAKVLIAQPQLDSAPVNCGDHAHIFHGGGIDF